jgi:putative addiction module component (TIGR02574 family)
MTDHREASDIEVRLAELMALPPARRLELGERLIESVLPFATPEVDRAWNEDIARRLDDLKAGRVQPIASEVVHGRIRERLRMMAVARGDG